MTFIIGMLARFILRACIKLLIIFLLIMFLVSISDTIGDTLDSMFGELTVFLDEEFGFSQGNKNTFFDVNLD